MLPGPVGRRPESCALTKVSPVLAFKTNFNPKQVLEHWASIRSVVFDHARTVAKQSTRRSDGITCLKRESDIESSACQSIGKNSGLFKKTRMLKRRIWYSVPKEQESNVPHAVQYSVHCGKTDATVRITPRCL